jgi:Ca2+-binding EF-hand superfamily protein
MEFVSNNSEVSDKTQKVKKSPIERMSSQRNIDAITDVFNKYDTKKIGKLDREGLRNCLFDLNGRNLDEAEVFFLLISSLATSLS